MDDLPLVTLQGCIYPQWWESHWEVTQCIDGWKVSSRICRVWSPGEGHSDLILEKCTFSFMAIDNDGDTKLVPQLPMSQGLVQHQWEVTWWDGQQVMGGKIQQSQGHCEL